MPASETDLRLALQAMASPPADEARERLLAAMSARVASAPRRQASKRRWVLAVLAAALFAASPPGQAVAQRIGELVGIGEESSVTEPDLRDPRLDNSQERVGPAIVTATGTVPSVEEPFEILAWAGKYKSQGPISPHVENPTRDGEIVSCMGSVYPGVGEQWTTKICLGPREEPSTLHVISVGQFRPNTDRLAADAPYVVEGQVSDDTARVVLSYEDGTGEMQEVDATLGIASSEIANRTKMNQRLGFFAGFIPYDGGDQVDYGLVDSRALRTLMVTTYDADGQVIKVFDEGARYGRALDSQIRREQLGVAAIYAACQEYGDQFPEAKCDRAAQDVAQTPGAAEVAGSLEISRIGDLGVVVQRGNFETLIRF